ncbi:hypothetical protein EJ110_NYTH35877 [Nymphaea thermarum]|nr:hypothetical protein EJ110_NYTH35877 [Nymphaea thermarum]
MASTSFLHIFPHLKPSPSYNLSNSPKLSHSSKKTVIKCSSQPQQSQSQSQSELQQTTELEEEQENSPIQIRSKAQLVKEKKPSDLAKTEPPNFEIGWKRTKKLPLEKKKGYMIMDFLDKLEGLMGRQYGTTELLAKAGGIVAERVREEAEILRNKGEVEDRLVLELFRVLKLMEMELEMVKAAKKEETLNERLEQAKARCRQAILERTVEIHSDLISSLLAFHAGIREQGFEVEVVPPPNWTPSLRRSAPVRLLIVNNIEASVSAFQFLNSALRLVVAEQARLAVSQ